MSDLAGLLTQEQVHPDHFAGFDSTHATGGYPGQGTKQFKNSRPFLRRFASRSGCRLAEAAWLVPGKRPPVRLEQEKEPLYS